MSAGKEGASVLAEAKISCQPLGQAAVDAPLLHGAGWWLFWPSLLLALSSSVGYVRTGSRG
jgi:hypothetical protein